MKYYSMSPYERKGERTMYMKVENMENRDGRAIPNQFIIKRDGETCFQSYQSLIAVLDGDKLTLGCDWDYSTTTSKYLYQFIREYCLIAIRRFCLILCSNLLNNRLLCCGI